MPRESPHRWQLVVFVGVAFWASAGAIRALNAGWLDGGQPAPGAGGLTTGLLLQHLAITAIAILLYVLANAVGWPRQRRYTAALQHAVLVGAFAICVPPILLATQAATALRLAGTLDYLVTYVLGLIVILGVRSRMELRDAELAQAALQEAATRAHLYALRMQMNPHFAFNTLNSIAALLERDPDRARTLLYAMSGLFQRTLAASRHEWHTLAEELRIAQDYLRIQSERAAHCIDFELLADEDTARTRIPSLLLQPLIENAVLHGVSDGRDRLRVWLRAWRQANHGSELRLHVEVGNSANAPVNASLARRGLGLGNTQQRLESVYGDRGRMHCRCPDIGTWVVDLDMPANA